MKNSAMENLTSDQKFASLGLTLPPLPGLGGIYKPTLVVGNLLYVSGHGPFQNDHTYIAGRIGKDLDIEQGRLAAKQVGLTILATLKATLGSFDKIKRVIKLLGMVNSTADFTEHPTVINGCSELFASVWGDENGVGVRSAVGFGSLPGNIPVEIEMIFELK